MCASIVIIASNKSFPAFADDVGLTSSKDGHLDDGSDSSVHTSRVTARGHDGDLGLLSGSSCAHGGGDGRRMLWTMVVKMCWLVDCPRGYVFPRPCESRSFGQSAAGPSPGDTPQDNFSRAWARVTRGRRDTSRVRAAERHRMPHSDRVLVVTSTTTNDD